VTKPPPAPPPSPRGDAPYDLATLYRLHADDVARWAYQLGGPDLDVEDVVHDVFVTVERLLPRFKREGARVTTWLYRITRNLARYERRKQRWRRWLRGSAAEVGDELVDSDTPIDRLEQREATRLVYKLLDALPEKYRAVLVLSELEGLSGEQIGELLGARPATVWVWLHRARQKFSQRLAALCPEQQAVLLGSDAWARRPLA
jgi:RNA polymerase sigma-70 factor (ECF subfamily)